VNPNKLISRAQARCPICWSNASVSVRPYRAGLPNSAKVFSGLSIQTCPTCSASFADPFPSKEALEAYYATDYRAADSWHRLPSEPGQWSGAYVRARSQFEFVSHQTKSLLKPIKSWLDIGAGYGCLLDEARRQGIETTAAIETDQHSRGRLRRRGHQNYNSLSKVKHKWDVISFSHFLEHLSSPPDFLQQIKDRLSDNGCVFCEVPNELHLQEAQNDAPHLVFFTLHSLSWLFHKIGFQVLTVQTCGKIIKGRGWDTWTDISRRIAMRLFHTPPAWFDRAIHPHYRYSDKDDRAWIRLLARKRDT